MTDDVAFKALLFGVISSCSLPLGALVALFWKPGNRVTAALMAFGAGALIAALTLDLVAESIVKGEIYPLLAGSLIGGILFSLGNQMLNDHGGFLRKVSTTVNYFHRKKLREVEGFYRTLSTVPVFQHLPAPEMTGLAGHLKRVSFNTGDILIKQGDPGDSMFFIQSGVVSVLDSANQDKQIAQLGKGNILGEIALLTGAPRSATVKAIEPVTVWMISKEDFDCLSENSPELLKALNTLIESRLHELITTRTLSSQKAHSWFRKATRHLSKHITAPSHSEIRAESESKGGAAMGIWLGNLLDGIPDSLVIGASMIHSSLSLSLIAGLFLSNFPEALSSSIEMKEQGMKKWKPFWMWMSLMILTGIGAYAGNIFFQETPEFIFIAIEGIAAGAMLTMVAETMLPEAFHLGGSVTGLSTLAGFLAAIFFKTLE